jgi:hypothetical protein
MGRGIKKISENVIADKRSLLLTTAGMESGLQDSFDKLPDGLTNTEAMPLGMLQADYSNIGLSMKVYQGKKDAESIWSKLDAKHTLLQQSVITPLIKDYNITTIKIANSAVTTEKIKHSAVVTDRINDLAVTTQKINNLAVTTAKINDRAVTTNKIDHSAVTTIKINDLAVTTPKINDSAVVTTKIKDLNVTTPKINDYAVTNIKLGNESVTNNKIANKTINGFQKITHRTIEAININVNGVARDNLQDACINTQKIEDLTIVNSKIANETIDGTAKVVKNSINKDRLSLQVNDMLDRSVLHDGNGNITGNGKDGSTVLNNIKANGDIYAHRVYNVVYMDIAEGYEAGEILEPGDIVAMNEDGKVYKATSIRDCIVGVVSNEYAHCLGASEEELLCGDKVAVGMIGKIHVKVKGPVRLGQRVGISLSDPGIGMANWMNNNHNIGQALESVDCDFDHIHTILVQVRPM